MRIGDQGSDTARWTGVPRIAPTKVFLDTGDFRMLNAATVCLRNIQMRFTYVVVRSMRPSALRRITLLVMKSDRFRSAPATLQPMLTGITGDRCEPSGASLSASNLFDRIEHAAPFGSAHDTIWEEAPSQA